MSQKLSPSELILNPDGSIYHLQLLPGDLAETIITVGDQERVHAISKHFDRIEVQKQNREFTTHTGYIGDKRLSVISTGIGTDNIDIVFNEIDALFNIDFENRLIKEELTSLSFIRVGTSGSLQDDLPLDSFLFTEYAVGLDNLFTFYETISDRSTINIQTDFQDFCARARIPRYNTIWHKGSADLLSALKRDHDAVGVTLTCPGFYGPQGRQLRLVSKLNPFIDALSHFRSGEHRFTNFEMETSGIYGMCHQLGHQALSCNAILANRKLGTFSEKPKATIERLIAQVLESLTSSTIDMIA